jgi:hypothetical protein
MPDTNQELSRNQERALGALVTQPTLPLAAAQVGVSPRTLQRWLHDDAAFQTAYRAVRKEIVQNAALQLQKACNNAANAVISLMNDPETPASTRLAAARTILEMALEVVKIEELEMRIATLEQAQQQREQQRSTNGYTGY